MSSITINILPENFSELPIWFHTVCDNFPQPTTKRPGGHPDFNQILIVTDGFGVLKCNGKEYPLKKGCAFFTSHRIPSEYTNIGGLTTAFLTVNGSAVESITKNYGIEDFLFCPHLSCDKYIADIKNITNEYYTYKRQGVMSAMAYSFYVNFFEEQANHQFSVPEKIALYIEKHYMEKLTLADIAKHHNISVSKLCFDFKQHFGYTIFQYIINLRLTHAQNALFSFPQRTAKDIAFSCGFEDMSYFCKAYKEKFGATPSKDRKKSQKTGL